MSKDTLYIEADDEITTVIEKVVSSKLKVIAVVLPKHAVVFQSAVNMKLLKKAAKEAKKNLVLITSEPAIKSIAGVSGMHIAKTLTSKPAIPKKPKVQDNETTITTDDVDVEETESDIDKNLSADEEETIEIDNTKDPSNKVSEADKNNSKKKKPKFKIPDFSSFRLKMGLGLLAIILAVVGWFFAFTILPEASLTITTDTSRIDVNTDFIAKVGQETADYENGILPATKIEIDKEDSVTVPATGEKNVGELAKGTMTLTNCVKSAVSIPSGTSFSVGSYTFVTSSAVELGAGVYIGDNCRSSDFPNLTTPGAAGDVPVVATQPGEGFNLDARSYTSSVSGVSAFGSDMTGGTTKLATVVSEEDRKNAADQLTGLSTADAVDELKAALNEKQLNPLEETLQETDAKTIYSSAVDTEVSELTVTRTVKYSMSGVLTEDLSIVLDNKVLESLGDKSQNVRSNGLSSAVYRLIEKTSDTEHQLSIHTVAVIGPELNVDTIKSDIIGKKLGEIENLLENREGVKTVEVEFSPFWIFQVPSKPDKITILINEE